MIKTFRSRALKRLHEFNDDRGINPDHLQRVKVLLAHLEAATKPSNMDFPGSGLHPLKGNRKGFWSVKISGNWRLIFRMDDGDAYDVELVDYH